MITSVFIGTSMASADVISDRKAGFRENVTALKAIRAAMKNNDMETISQNADKVAAWFAVMPSYFPEGSGEGDTKASPQIWNDWDKFTRFSAEAEQFAVDLSTAAKNNDKKAVKEDFSNVAGTCKSCHFSFKSK